MAVRLLKAALTRPELTMEDAITIMNYHLRRNRIAQKSHHKRWLQRHKGVEFKRLL